MLAPFRQSRPPEPLERIEQEAAKFSHDLVVARRRDLLRGLAWRLGIGLWLVVSCGSYLVLALEVSVTAARMSCTVSAVAFAAGYARWVASRRR